MTRAYWVVSVLLAFAIACGDDAQGGPPDAGEGDPDAGVKLIDRSALTDIGTAGRLDYATPEYWVCRPDIEPNECARDLDATEIKADGSLEVIEHVAAEDPAFDCFYVYPTVWSYKTANMTDFSEEGVKLVLDALLSQGARFNRICRVFAPLYRQAGLNGAVLTEGADPSLALQDVRDAFARYIEHDNHGRKFVLLGHSQGTFMLSSLIARDIDDNPALRARMISAVLLGGQPYTQPGEPTDGSFKNIRPCTERGEAGCVIAFNMFAQEAPPTASAIMGRVGTALTNEEVDTAGQVICVDPAPLGHAGERYAGSYYALSLHNPRWGTPVRPAGIETPFVLYRDMLRGECRYRDGLSYLEISLSQQAGDVRQPPAYRNALLEGVGFGMHLVDYSVALEDLIRAVELQAATALK